MNQPTRYRRKLMTGLGLLVLLLGAWLGWPDRRLAAAKALQQELFGPAGKQLSAEERRQKFRQLREATKGLTPAQRQWLSAEASKRRKQEIARYFSLSPQDKLRYLDQQIRRRQGFGQGG